MDENKFQKLIPLLFLLRYGTRNVLTTFNGLISNYLIVYTHEKSLFKRDCFSDSHIFSKNFLKKEKFDLTEILRQKCKNWFHEILFFPFFHFISHFGKICNNFLEIESLHICLVNDQELEYSMTQMFERLRSMS